MKKTLTFLAIAGILVFCPSKLTMAEDAKFEETATGKAAKELITNFTNFVKDVSAMRNMTDQQKVDYILTQGKERIGEVRAEHLKDTVKTKMLDYVQARMRADLFKSKVPDMMHQAIVEGKSVSALWSAADIDIKSKLDTQMNAVKSAVGAAEIGWDVYSTWSEKGATEGVRELGKQAGEKIIEYFIPGWGYYKLAQSAVTALGEYVVQYAFDTSLQAKLGVVLSGHDPKTNPAVFKDWILSLDVPGYVQREWDEQLAYGGWYLKGSDEGESMKRAIIAALEKMKAEVTAKAALEDQLRAKLGGLDDQAQAASDAVRNMIDASATEFKPALDLIDKYKSQIYEAQKQDEQVVADQQLAQMTQEEKHESYFKLAFPYEKFDHQAVLNPLRDVMALATESGPDGYDAGKLDSAYDDYMEARTKVLTAASNKVEENIRKSQEMVTRLDNQYGPPLNALWQQIYDSWNNEARYNALCAQRDALSSAYGAARFPYLNIAMRNFLPEDLSADIGVLSTEEQMVMMDGKEREAKLNVFLDKLSEEFQSDIARAEQDYIDGAAAFGDKVGALSHPDGISAPGVYSNIASEMQRVQFAYYQPGDVIKVADQLQQQKKDLLADKELLPVLMAAQKKIFEDYVAAMDSIIKRFENQVPKALQKKVQGGSGQATYEYSLEIGDMSNSKAIKVLPVVAKRVLVQMPRIWGVWNSQADQAKALSSSAEIQGAIDAAIAAITKKLDEIEPQRYADEMVLIFERLLQEIIKDPAMFNVTQTTLDQEKKSQTDGSIFALKNYSGFMQIEPEKMKGAQYLEALKQGWDKAKPMVDKLNNLKKGIGKVVQYSTGFQDYAYLDLDRFNSVPDRIALYEATLAQAKKDFDERLALAHQQLTDAKAKRDQIDKNSWMEDRVTQLENFQKNTVQRNLQLYAMWAKTDAVAILIADWKGMEQETDSVIENAKKAVEEGNQAIADKRAADQAARQKQDADAQSQAQAAQLRNDHGFTLSQYQLYDQRINTQTLPVIFGDLVLLTDDLKQGAITLTARLSTVDKLDRILISEDNGRTWSELSLSQNISYTFTPIPEKMYNPVLKIRSTLGDELEIPFFSMVNIIYRDINVQQLIAESVKKIADAYERQDVSGFMQYFSRDFQGNKTFMEDGARLDFDLFSSIRLTIYINRIDKQRGFWVADTKWDKDQVPKQTGQVQKTSGNTTMMFVLEDGLMKIQNLRGNLIYATLSPEIAQSSGLGAGIVDQIRTANQERNPVQPGAGKTEDPGGTAVVNGVTLTSPVGGETWHVGDSKSITWTVTGSYSSVKILYSTNSGATFPNTITSSASASSGSYAWTVPNDPGSTVRVRIEDVSDPATYDVSAGDFTIAAVGGGTLTVVTPTSASHPTVGTFLISWTNSGIGPYVKIDLSGDGGATFPTNITANSGGGGPTATSYTWNVPGAGLLNGCNKVIRITSIIDSSVHADSQSFCVN